MLKCKKKKKEKFPNLLVYIFIQLKLGQIPNTSLQDGHFSRFVPHSSHMNMICAPD